LEFRYIEPHVLFPGESQHGKKGRRVSGEIIFPGRRMQTMIPKLSKNGCPKAQPIPILVLAKNKCLV